MPNTSELPTWLHEPVMAAPASRGSRFLTANLRSVAEILNRLNQPRAQVVTHTAPGTQLVTLLVLVVLTVSAHNGLTLELLAALWLAELLLLPGQLLWPTLKNTLGLAVFGLIMLLPGLIINAPQLLVLMVAKYILVVGHVAIFRQRTGWANLIVGLKQLHVPALFVLTLDVTLKYSHVLASYLQESLQAVSLRSVGTPAHPLQLSGHILGCLYLNSRDYMRELYQAMTLRGYNAVKPRPVKWRLQGRDGLILVGDVILIILAVLIRG